MSNLVSETHLTNYLFDGARADLSKTVSQNPAFQISHSFALASATKPSSYNFGAVFANAQVCSHPITTSFTREDYWFPRHFLYIVISKTLTLTHSVFLARWH